MPLVPPNYPSSGKHASSLLWLPGLPTRPNLSLTAALNFSSPFETRDPSNTGELFDIDADSAVKLYRIHGAPGDSLPISRDFCDDRLSGLHIAAWTTVQVSNELAARIISLYLKTDHPLLGTFDPDLFVSDLINQQERFCSSLLVNALLYWGTVCDETHAMCENPLTGFDSKCIVPLTRG